MRKSIIGAVALAIGLMATGAQASSETATNVHFVEMDEINVPIVDGNRVDGALRLKLVIDAADAEAAERLSSSLPALRQAALGAALDFARIQASAFAPVDVSALDSALTDALGEVDKAAARVLIVEVSARRQ